MNLEKFLNILEVYIENNYNNFLKVIKIERECRALFRPTRGILRQRRRQ